MDEIRWRVSLIRLGGVGTNITFHELGMLVLFRARTYEYILVRTLSLSLSPLKPNYVYGRSVPQLYYSFTRNRNPFRTFFRARLGTRFRSGYRHASPESLSTADEFSVHVNLGSFFFLFFLRGNTKVERS